MKTQNNATFKPLALSTLKKGTGFSRPYFHSPNPVEISSSALEVMTDLRFVPAATTHSDIPVTTASQKMIARGVRLLLVVDRDEDVIGLITAHDLDGNRISDASQSTGLSFAELTVGHIMTRDMEALPLQAVLHARVGDIVETLKDSGRQHALILDEEPFTNKPMIRGVFSASQIARQLGIISEKNNLAQTFSQIEQTITARQASQPLPSQSSPAEHSHK
jgi:signal-transduction protein with cAMP-binding, CBS, and nucleotidyltransferase domain